MGPSKHYGSGEAMASLKRTAQLIRPFMWIILAFTLCALLLAAVIGTGQDAATILSIFRTRFLGIFIEAVPFLLLGTLVSVS
jgi:hypothetical protein